MLLTLRLRCLAQIPWPPGFDRAVLNQHVEVQLLLPHWKLFNAYYATCTAFTNPFSLDSIEYGGLINLVAATFG